MHTHVEENKIFGKWREELNFEKAYDGVNREVLWQVLRMYDLGGKLVSAINSIYVDSSACVRIKGV